MSTAITPTSNLGAAASGLPDPGTSGGIVPAAQQAAASVQQATPSQPTTPTPPAQSGSRLARIISAVANVADTALSGIPQGRRPDFVSGLGSGARAEQASVATQNDLKFRNFQDQFRLAQLHNEDIRMQWADEDHQAAVQANADAQAKRMTDSTGMTYTFVPNDDGGKAVLAHMGAQMAQDGHVTVPAGVIAGPKGWYIPNQGSAEQSQANTQDYNARAPFYGLPTVPKGGVVSDASYDILRNMSNGFAPGGQTLHGSEIQSRVDNAKEALAKYKATPNANASTISAVQSDIDHLQNLATITTKRDNDALDQASQRKQDEQTNQIQQKGEQTRLTNAAKPQKPQSDAWVPGATADEKKKAELAENMVFNANNIASILQRRPDIVGKVAGRITNVQQMAGTNDPDIVQLGTDIHNIAMANNGIHGLRSAEAVTDFENKLLNNFKNGPQGIAGGLMGSVKSVQTFIDNARPETYKTHSKQGGAIKAMVPQQ